MISFLRKSRKRLLTENKFSKYLLYAIGEIVLVVVGILIALQINNGNEQRKANQKETIILNELLNSIDKDLTAYERYLYPRLERKVSGLDSLRKYIFSDEVIEDSVFISFYRKARQDIYLRFDMGPFEALKSSGLDLIRNDSLRTKLNDAYTVSLPLYTYFGNEYYEEYNGKIETLQFEILEFERAWSPQGVGFLTKKLKVKDILENQDFLAIYTMEQKKYREYKTRLNQCKETLIDLKTSIVNELSS